MFVFVFIFRAREERKSAISLSDGEASIEMVGREGEWGNNRSEGCCDVPAEDG